MADRTFCEAESLPLPQTLRTDRLLLRAFVRSDPAAIFSYPSDTDVRVFVGELAVEDSIFGLIRSDWGVTSVRSEADLEPGSG